MNPQVRSMLEAMYTCIHKREPDPGKAWDNLLELVAADNSALFMREFDRGLDWLFTDRGISAELLRIYQPALLRYECRDDLGSFYNSKFYRESGLENCVIQSRQRKMRDPSVNFLAPEHPDSVLYMGVGSGGILMETHKRVPEAKLFGVETDLRLYRIALTNCAMHNIPALVLHADPYLHELDPSEPNGKYNWQFANRWNSYKDLLRPRYNRPTMATTS